MAPLLRLSPLAVTSALLLVGIPGAPAPVSAQGAEPPSATQAAGSQATPAEQAPSVTESEAAGAAQEPKKDEPKAEEPKKDEPKAEEPKKDEPKPEEPKKDDAKPAESKAEPEKPASRQRLRIPGVPVLGEPVRVPGYPGPSTVPQRAPQSDPNFLPVPDRWRYPLPAWLRYPPGGQGAPFHRSRGWFDPFNQSVLKGDYPILGQNTFLQLDVLSETLFNARSRYTPSGTSAARPGSYTFFGGPNQVVVDQTFLLSTEVFHGDTSFKPKDWAIKFTPALNVNFLNAREQGVVDVDVREFTSRTSLDSIGIEDLFGEYKIADLSRNYDFLSMRTGVQPFNADFRGFLFVNNSPGIRFFGNTKSNRNQFNLAYFRPWEKDTYSRLNRVGQDRGQDVFIANFYRQDLFRPGYTGQITAAYNHDHASRHFNNDAIQVRPSLIGAARPHDVRVGYIGFNGDGHFGRINISHSFYQAFGEDDFNPVAGRRVRINAQMAAAEISYDRDWYRVKASVFYASGDNRPNDSTARGFDAIVDNPNFFGGPFSFINSQGLRLTGANVDLFGENSLLATLRGSKIEGQANFVNPGVFIAGAGTDVELTPKWKLSANINYIRFNQTRTLEVVLNQNNISRSVGIDFSLGLRHRPFLNDNVIWFLGASALMPSRGVKDIFQDQTLYSVFTKVQLLF